MAAFRLGYSWLQAVVVAIAAGLVLCTTMFLHDYKYATWNMSASFAKNAITTRGSRGLFLRHCGHKKMMGTAAAVANTTSSWLDADGTSRPCMLRHLQGGGDSSTVTTTTVQQSFAVEIVVALHYVDYDTAVALETRDPANAIVHEFCTLVQQQASGQQVDFAAEEVDVTISTSGSTNECTILDTVFAYDTGGQVLGTNFMTIEIHFQQVVYTTASQEDARPLTIDVVTGLVKNGFNRGRGGRVKFRTLLQETTAFANVLDVEVLSELGPPMLPPTPTPTTEQPPTVEPTSSAAPSRVPSDYPSVSPTQAPSAIPSLGPSVIPSAAPSGNPSGAPSAIPTIAPSGSPTFVTMANNVPPTLSNDGPSNEEPSAEPSAFGSIAAVASTTDDVGTPPYVIAAIALGSWAVVMACCFSVFLCRKQKRQSDERELLANDGRPNNEDSSTPPLRDTNRNGQHSVQQDSQNDQPFIRPIVPNVVLADDDHRSLANTTLGEETAGRRPPKKKRLVDTNLLVNSFEDDSLYTTPIGIIPRIEPGRRIDEDDDVNAVGNNRIHSPPTSLGVTSAFGSDIFFSSENGSSSQESWTMPQSPVASKIGGLVAAELGSVSGDNPEALPSEQGSQYTESRDDVDGTSASAAWPTQQLSPRSSHSSLHSSLHSSDTLKAQNVAATSTLTADPKMSGEDHSTVDAPGTYARSGSSSLLVVRKKIDDKLFEKEPFRSPLQLLETHKEESPGEVGSRERSPMQLLHEEDVKTDVSPIDLHDDSVSSAELRMSSSNDRPPRLKTHRGQIGKASARTPMDAPPNDHTARRSVSPYRTRYLQGLQSPTAQKELEQTQSFGSQQTPPQFSPNSRPEPPMDGRLITPRIVTPPSELLPAAYNAKQKGNARHNTIESPPPVALTEGDISVLTTSSSEASTGDDRWLFGNVAQCLGPRSTSADMVSLGGKSTKSNKSGKSWRSQRSVKSLGTRRGRNTRKRSSGASRGSQRSSFSFGSPGDYPYKSSSDFSLAPRSLENDLRRLEQQLASLKSTDPKKETPRMPPSPPGMTGSSNSFSASSMSSSRKVSSKQRVIVVAPPGKLGVVLANRHNGTGTVVSELRGSSVLRGALFPGDKLVAVDENDVTGLNVSQITAIMAKRSDHERRLTVITPSKARSRAANAAMHGSTTASESESSP